MPELNETAEGRATLPGPGVPGHGRPRCERCGAVRVEDDTIMHRRWCPQCDQTWVEESILWPLVMRLGRGKARRALRALVRGEIGPQSK